MHGNKHIQKYIRTEKELLTLRYHVAKYYKEGYCLGELCRLFQLDVASVLLLLKKSKIKKKKLYDIYEYQNNRTNKNKDIIIEKEKYYIDKFFPYSQSFVLTCGFYWYWKDKYNKRLEQREKCNHSIRHIQCAKCNKILRDASNIPLVDVITRKLKTNDDKKTE